MTEETERIRVVIADDHPLILDGLEQLFRMEPRFAVIARCRNGSEALDWIDRERPALSILDLRMPELDGLQVLEQVEGKTRVILLTAELEDSRIARALRSGARGLILKERAAELLLDCVDTVLRGERWIDPDIAKRALRLVDEGVGRPDSPDSLSRRELDVARAVAAGLRNREIAEKLFISEGTVKSHLRAIFEKLAIDSRMDLANWVRREGLEE